jgi:hypothetical protein
VGLIIFERYSNDGSDDMQGLKDKLCCGQLADIPLEKLLEVKKKLSEHPSGGKQVMNL